MLNRLYEKFDAISDEFDVFKVLACYEALNTLYEAQEHAFCHDNFILQVTFVTLYGLL